MKNNIDKKAVGRRIKQIRINKGCTLEAFGKLIGASKSSVSEWETGKHLPPRKSIVLRWENGTSLPNQSRLEIIAKLGNMTVNELLYGDTEKDIQELYEQIIKLPKEDAKTLLTNVVNYLKENEQCK